MKQLIDNAVKLTFRPERKRNDYYIWLYREVLIYDGWLEAPDDLFWKTVKEENGMIVRKSRFLSCDKTQYDVVLEYFKNNGIDPVVNTYKPGF